MREFERFGCQFGRFIVGAIKNVELQLDRGKTVPQFRLLVAERLLIDFVAQPHVQEPILLNKRERRLPRQFIALARASF